MCMELQAREGIVFVTNNDAQTTMFSCTNCKEKFTVYGGDLARCFSCVEPLCWGCWENGGECDPCVRREWGRMMQAKRKVKAGGRPAVKRPCGLCRKKFTARDLRAHVPKCQGRSRKVASGMQEK